MSARPRAPRSVLAAVAATLALAFVNIPQVAADDPVICDTAGTWDPRCSPDYCRDPANAGDPWCEDPEFCENHPDDPMCEKGDPVEPGEKKQTCVWTVDGVPLGSVVPVFRQSNPGPHAVRLECPNHDLSDWECREKARDGTDLPTTGQDEPLCTYHGASVDPVTCAAVFAWTVTVPDFNTWTVELHATTFKVEPVLVDPTGGLGTPSNLLCKGPLDWNTSKTYEDADGRLRTFCVLENEFLAKDHLWKQDGEWHHYHFPGDGTYEYHTHPNQASMPDGVIDECDFQSYSVQWRQWN